MHRTGAVEFCYSAVTKETVIEDSTRDRARRGRVSCPHCSYRGRQGTGGRAVRGCCCDLAVSLVAKPPKPFKGTNAPSEPSVMPSKSNAPRDELNREGKRIRSLSQESVKCLIHLRRGDISLIICNTTANSRLSGPLPRLQNAASSRCVRKRGDCLQPERRTCQGYRSRCGRASVSGHLCTGCRRTWTQWLGLESTRGVFVEVEGEGETVRRFLLRLEKEKPPRASSTV